jgi:hypothetical protein
MNCSIRRVKIFALHHRVDERAVLPRICAHLITADVNVGAGETSDDTIENVSLRGRIVGTSGRRDDQVRRPAGLFMEQSRL